MAEDKKQEQAPKNTPQQKTSRSKTAYPYYNMETSLEVARVIHERGGGTCTPDQLAPWLKYSSTRNGTFVARVSAAKMFGFIISEKGEMSVSDRAKNIFAEIMPEDSKKAKVDAFLDIELFRAVYDQFIGSTLPADSGLENLLKHTYKIVPDRVGPALRVLKESAEFAGFFESGSNRLVKPPVVSNSSNGAENSEGERSPDSGRGKQEQDQNRSSIPNAYSPSIGIHSAISGLLRELPPQGTPWSKGKKEKFLAAFTAMIDVIYPEEET